MVSRLLACSLACLLANLPALLNLPHAIVPQTEQNRLNPIQSNLTYLILLNRTNPPLLAIMIIVHSPPIFAALAYRRSLQKCMSTYQSPLKTSVTFGKRAHVPSVGAGVCVCVCVGVCVRVESISAWTSRDVSTIEEILVACMLRRLVV